MVSQTMTDGQVSNLGVVGTGETSCSWSVFSVFRLQWTVPFGTAEPTEARTLTLTRSIMFLIRVVFISIPWKVRGSPR